MKNIEKVLIAGLGAIGGYYALKMMNDVTLKVLVDKERLLRYKKEPRIINDRICEFDYVLPEYSGFKADLIIIATKSSGLSETICNIRNFVGDDTIILSFLNGITSEQEIIKEYGNDKVLYSYLIGHTFFRSGNYITHDGKAKIVFGSTIKNDVKVDILREFFEKMNICYSIPNDIRVSQWQKYCFNCCLNQLSAITGKTFGEIKSSKYCLNIIKHISDEVEQVANCENVDFNDFYSKTIEFLDLMIPDGKTSMLQDIEAGIFPETDIFGETVTRLGEKHNIPTPYNRVMSEIIRAIV